MIKRLAAVLVALTLALVGLGLTTDSAEAAKRCRGSKSSGVCYSVSHSTKNLKVVQSVLLENKRKKKGTVIFHCSFSDTISRSFEAGASLTTTGKVDILKLAEVSVSTTLSLKVSQTASSAVSAAADVPLKKGERVLCQRTYGFVKTKVTETHYTASSVWTKSYWASIPIRMGVRVVDV